MPTLVRQKGSKSQRADDVVFADETSSKKSFLPLENLPGANGTGDYFVSHKELERVSEFLQ